MHVLQDRSQTLQSHAGVHTGCGQFDERSIGLHVELHENVVPDLNESVAIFTGAAGGATGNVGAVVVKDLRARTAGPGIGHHPEVVRRVFFALVVTNADHALRRQADFFRPDVVGLLVVDVDGGGEFVGRQLVDLRQQLPAPLQRVTFEVIAKAPVAQHLEKRVMPRGVAHVFQIIVLAARTQAGLHAGRAHVGALVSPQEHVFELHHAGVDKHQRGVVAGHQRAAGDDGVALAGEEVEE